MGAPRRLAALGLEDPDPRGIALPPIVSRARTGFHRSRGNPGVRLDYVFASASLKMSQQASGTLGFEHNSRGRGGAAPFTGRAARLEGGRVPRSRGVGSSAGVGRLRLVISVRHSSRPTGAGQPGLQPAVAAAIPSRRG